MNRTFTVATWRDRLVAGGALGGEVAAVAVAAEQRVALAGERLVGQRALAAEAAETVGVVKPVLVEHLLQGEDGRLGDVRQQPGHLVSPSQLRSEVSPHLGAVADELFTLLAGVGVQALVAGDAVRTVLHLDVFMSTEGRLAPSTAQLVTHDVWRSGGR